MQPPAAANWAWLILILHINELALPEVSGFYHLAASCIRCNSRSLKPVLVAAPGDHSGSQANTLIYHFHKHCGEPFCFFQHSKTFWISLWLLWQWPTFNTTNWSQGLPQHPAFIQNLTAPRRLSWNEKQRLPAPPEHLPMWVSPSFTGVNWWHFTVPV